MSDPQAPAVPASGGRRHVVVVYSDDPVVRSQVITAVGRRPAPDLGRIDWIECATGEQVVARVDRGGVDLLVLDGEAWPTGGMGLSKQLKDEITDCPPTLVLIARRDDAWLAEWSLADAVARHPVDPPTLIHEVAEQLRRREARVPVRRYGG